ncbi:TraB/VirB10 family protein [Bdellovibrionota bacterium FG-1]
MNRIMRGVHEWVLPHRDKLPYVAMAVIILVVYGVSKVREATTYVYKSEEAHEFKEGRVLGYQGDSIYAGKERLFSKTVREIQTTLTTLKDATAKIQSRLDVVESGKPLGLATMVSAENLKGEANAGKTGIIGKDTIEAVRTGQPVEELPVTRVRESQGGERSSRHSRGGRETGTVGSIISFPVKEVVLDRSQGIVLPAGSYVKAKLMTGVEAPEGKTYPVLLQLDYAYIVPNKHRVDLSGCFMIAKSQGDLSTERVQMQASKLSCVSKEGRMFEREVSGFIADDKDNSFAVMGSVNSKQDRVAAMAFLSSIVEGVGKAIQQAQTTQQTTPLGGSQSAVTGSSAEYMAAGGASSAASMVTQWYLKQAQNLLPTINIGSGQDVWVIMQDTVKLPTDYFKKSSKGGQNDGVYSYLSRVLD